MRKIILRNPYSLGDDVLFTAAIRDLHRCHPNQFITGIETAFPDLWQFNPMVTTLDSADPDVETINCHFPLIGKSNVAPFHAIHGFIEFLNGRLGLNIRPTLFKGDVRLSAEEKSWMSQVHEIVGMEIPYWILVAGGKRDVTIKWWSADRWQKVVDHFLGRIQFVQVGAECDYHPKLDGVIDLRGKTDIRQLIRLVYHAQGVLCPVTSLMHLAAAVDVKNGMPKNRPCVVVAGGREPSHWESYSHHQYIHTNGALPCCDNGGCWKSRVKPLGDGDERDRPENLCVDVVKELPRCMDMITADAVVQRISSYFDGKYLRYLNTRESRATARAISFYVEIGWKQETVDGIAFRRASEAYVATIPPYPETFKGRGIVICAGGEKYFACAWVLIKMLRQLGCRLPIQVWYLNAGEMDSRMRRLISLPGVQCIDASAIQEKEPARIMHGWALKPYALLHSTFKELLLLDADNVPVVNPECLFRTSAFKETGAIFWPDFGRLARSRSIWKLCGVNYVDEPEFETGQIVIDKKRCWKALNLTMWYNEHADFVYQHIHGDKDTFHMAFRKLRQRFSMPSKPVASIGWCMCQHDFEGRRIFQHRNLDKWEINGSNRRISGFQFENQCLDFLNQLRRRWHGVVEVKPVKVKTLKRQAAAPTYDNDGVIQPKTNFRKRPSKNIVFRCPVNVFTGYGLHAFQIVTDLEQKGFKLKIRPTEIDELFARIPHHLRRRIVQNPQPSDWELILHPPNISPTPGKKTIFFTMWEASRLPEEWVNWLNRSECVVVPCQWNATCFSASGVTKPIRIIPLGIKTKIFQYTPMGIGRPCVFGAAGKMGHGGERKSLNEVIELFQDAFPVERDVRLRIKAFPDCGVVSVNDPRIDVIAGYLSELELAKWYASLNCFVSVSRSEGWGLMPHQAMSVGRSVIAMKFGGQAEFLNDQNGYCVHYNLESARYNYAGGGVWAKPDREHTIELMRQVYRNPKENRRLGQVASKSVQHLTWEYSNNCLIKILREFKMVQ